VSAILAALGRMRAYRNSLVRSPIPALADPAVLLRPLIDAVRQIEERSSGQPDHAPPGDLVAASRRQWAAVSPNFTALSRRAARILCSDPETLDDELFANGLRGSGRLRESNRWGERLLLAYDMGWTHERAHKWGPLIREAFAGHTRRSRKATTFLGTTGLLSSKAAEILASVAIARLLDVKDLAEAYQILTTGQLFGAVRASLVDVWFGMLGQSRSEEEQRRFLEFGFRHFVDAKGADPKSRAQVLYAIIMAPRPSDTRIIEWLRAAVLASEHLGDPRKPANRNNWSLVHKDARQRFVQWLAREDLRFFFEAVMANTPDPHGRQHFWDKWLENDHLVDSAVALGYTDEYYLRSRSALPKDAVYGRLDGGQGQVSAFLLRFRTTYGDIIAVEFSQAGNAAYFHNGEGFDRKVGGIHRAALHLSLHLKNKETELSPPPGCGPAWDHHRVGWEYTFEHALRYYLR
jgi:hypothetical protein